jgi:RNA polymerase sigma-70 factor (ECF subfamily)
MEEANRFCHLPFAICHYAQRGHLPLTRSVMSERELEAAAPRIFATTHWTVVLAAGEGDSASARRALEMLCAAYWYPIYVYVRRKGHGPDDAEDLTQEFFAQLIAKEHLRLADRTKGKFRTFLLAMLDQFLANARSRAHRQKRGGQFQFVSLDQQSAEERYALEPADDGGTPEEIFLRQWALTLLKKTTDALARKCAAEGKQELFEVARRLLHREGAGVAYAEVAGRLGMSEGAMRVAVHRLRQRFGELLREEIAQTVSSPGEIEEELRFLMRVLSG